MYTDGVKWYMRYSTISNSNWEEFIKVDTNCSNKDFIDSGPCKDCNYAKTIIKKC
jgi:hypothetical protein